MTDHEQPSIFDEIPTATRVTKDREPKQRTIAYGACPYCSNRKVGLVRSIDGRHLVWRDHHLVTHGGIRIQCRVVGQHLCDHPSREVDGMPNPQCPHQKFYATT